MLLATKYCTRQLIDRAFAQAKTQPAVQVEMNSIESILSTVRQGHLATLLPALALCKRDKGLKAVPLIEPKPQRAVGIVWLRGAHRPAAAKLFAEVTAKVLLERRKASNGS